MFIREVKTKNKKTGKIYVTHQLVESYKVGSSSRQRMILSLGKLKLPQSLWPRLAQTLENMFTGQSEIFTDTKLKKIAQSAFARYQNRLMHQQAKQSRKSLSDVIPIDLNSVEVTMSRSLGPELIGNAFWRRLNFEKILRENGFSDREISLSEAVILGRLISPGSDLATWHWYRQLTVLPELVELEGIEKDAVYEIADKLLSIKESLERTLYQHEQALFGKRAHLFIYDLTNTYFEGSCLKNDLARFGYSKEKRSDCVLVTLALVVDQDGFPIFSRIYKGNVSEPSTFEELVKELLIGKESLFSELRPTIVMDRGIAIQENVNLLRSLELPYVVVERKQIDAVEQKHFESDEEFERISAAEESGIYVKKISDNDRTKVLCYSERKDYKESGMCRKKTEMFLTALTRLSESIKKGNVKNLEKVHQRIGRIREKYPSVSMGYEIETVSCENKKDVSELLWKTNTKADTKEDLYGCYVIDTSHNDLSAAEIWGIYHTLTKVENAFRSLKTDLGTRPIYHQTETRTTAHLFISVLAYHVLICIEYALRQKGDHRSWSMIRKQLSSHQRATVVLIDDQDQIYHIRVSGVPETIHQEIYELLEIKNEIPRRKLLVGKRN